LEQRENNMSALLRLPIVSKTPALQPAQLLAEGFHELLCDRPGTETAALALAVSLAAPVARETGRMICVCSLASDAQEHGVLYGHGLSGFGLPPNKLLLVSAGKEKHLLWALEEALISNAFAAVIAVLGARERLYGFPESRRLKLRNVESGTPLYLLRHHSHGGATAAHGRWRIAPIPSRSAGTHAGFELLGTPRLRLTLEKLGGLPPQQWEMEYGTRGFRMAAVLPDRADRADERWRQAV
jgi:protein ImuA